MSLIHNDRGQERYGEQVEISLTRAANVHRMDSSNYSSYTNARRHSYIGGLSKKFPLSLRIPKDGHWHIAIDMQGLCGSTRAFVQMSHGTLPEIPKEALSSVPGLVRDNVPPIPNASSKDAEVLGVLVHHVDFDLDGYRLIAQGMYRARGRSGTPQGPQRATGGAERAERRPRLGGPEEYKRSTRSPGAGAWRRSAGMRTEHLLRVQQ